MPFELYIFLDTSFTSQVTIIIDYYTVDCTIPKYIWTSANMTTILEEPIDESNMVKLSGHNVIQTLLLPTELSI